MPIERSVSCAERSTTYNPTAPAATDLRCYSASYAPAPHPKVKRAKSTSSWSRSGSSSRTVSGAGGGGGPTPGLNLRCYSASYAASYAPFSDGASAQMRRANSTTWSSSGRRSVNLRGYTPSFAALDDTAAPAPAKKAAAPAPGAAAGGTFDDAELQRKKRLVAYKVYDVEGKMKASMRRSVKWIMGKYSRAVYGTC